MRLLEVFRLKARWPNCSASWLGGTIGNTGLSQVPLERIALLGLLIHIKASTLGEGVPVLGPGTCDS